MHLCWNICRIGFYVCISNLWKWKPLKKPNNQQIKIFHAQIYYSNKEQYYYIAKWSILRRKTCLRIIAKNHFLTFIAKQLNLLLLLVALNWSKCNIDLDQFNFNFLWFNILFSVLKFKFWFTVACFWAKMPIFTIFFNI